jgi:hypothetical protein
MRSVNFPEPTFYEQVADVNIVCVVFSLLAVLLLFFGLVVTHVALHRVSIRTLDELPSGELGARWGSVEESMLPVDVASGCCRFSRSR